MSTTIQRPALRGNSVETATLQSVRDRLAVELKFSPHDFVPGLSSAADREMQADNFTRPLSAESNLRTRFASPDGECAVLAERLAWDSEFFGVPMARLHGVADLTLATSATGETKRDVVMAAAIEDWLREARRQSIRYVVASVDTRDLPLARALGSAGFSLIETRVAFHRSVRDNLPADRFPTRLATAADVPPLSAAACAAVNPFDRFRADPFFPPQDVDRLLTRWIEASLCHGFADATMVPDERVPLAARQPVPAPHAFCTLKYHDDKADRWGRRVGQIVLVGRHPDAHGGGHCLRLMSEIVHHLHERGADHLFVVTQLANRPMVKNCERLGFAIGRGELTFRRVLAG